MSIHEAALIAAKPGGTAKNSRPGCSECARGVVVFGVSVLSSKKVIFKEVGGRYDGPALETEVLEFWREQDVFQKTLDQTEGKPQFSFNEGPPDRKSVV